MQILKVYQCFDIRTMVTETWVSQLSMLSFTIEIKKSKKFTSFSQKSADIIPVFEEKSLWSNICFKNLTR